ncbi:MAG: UDP-N-acetylmuramoyl-tripeptide--D-alanyl-D-alanine ligase [Patescibacteria group bacterium]|jgi:UDP-N-acetylmuramoyl-tripeptide--D-alanyl-D-alanine ligase|nr:UDP-N-acetylmuramoyl-tripeptide--D-alanyl-D-alanine ligase [bacterium]HQC49537.1 UDP-N-acetylmuramoyl-tripeptide--D-alanyl-D-alanine ligase [bacterium]
MKKLLLLQLKIVAQKLISKYKPVIISITGSIGKTSTKEAIYHVLKNKFSVRTSFKNYNNEIGLPLTIIGVESPGKSYFGWLLVFLRALRLLIFTDKKYPKILVLEMGVDRPGDMDYLISIAPPQIAVVTAVSYSHLEYFGNLNNIKKEKQKLVESLDSHGLAILNFDSEPVCEMASVSQARVMSFSLNHQSDIKAQDIIYNFSRDGYELSGINFKLNYQGSIVPVFMKNVMSEPALYASLAAAAVGLHFKMNLVEIADSLSDFSLPAGRMNVLPGIKHSFIIDDTYNSSPEAAISAVKILGKIKIDNNAKKYAIMGDMLEIGSFTEEGHQLVGKKIATEQIDVLVAVGERSRDFIRGAKEAGLEDEQIFYFDKPEEAGRFLQNRIKEGDVLLIKGSQGARMEKVVKELIAEPEQADKLLVRQSKEWQ